MFKNKKRSKILKIKHKANANCKKKEKECSAFWCVH